MRLTNDQMEALMKAMREIGATELSFTDNGLILYRIPNRGWCDAKGNQIVERSGEIPQPRTFAHIADSLAKLADSKDIDENRLQVLICEASMLAQLCAQLEERMPHA